MRLSISHTTRYSFAEPVVHALQRLRLTPKNTHGQEILSWSMSYENAFEELEYDDQHFNHVTLISVAPDVTEVIVQCEGVVDTQDKAGIIGEHSGHLPLWSFLSQTDLTKPGPKVKEMIRGLSDKKDDKLGFLHALSSRIIDIVEYKSGETDSKTTAEQALVQGAGVCQDHAHIFIGAARFLDIPARYVSGYLMMDDRIHQEATHAWAEAHVDGLGWVGFDVSNCISPDPRYVRVATGRDYRDAAPITGITFGGSAQVLEVDVSVEQQQVEQ